MPDLRTYPASHLALDQTATEQRNNGLFLGKLAGGSFDRSTKSMKRELPPSGSNVECEMAGGMPL